jgi:nucleoside-diphosphate-sugar epimerase
MNKNHPLYQEDLQNILKIKDIEQIKDKSFLITGATGMIGTCLIDALMLFNRQGADIHIYAVGRSKEKAYARLGDYYGDKYFHYIEQDVRCPFPEDLKVDYILPLASNTHPLAYAQYPIETIEINVKGAEYALLKAVQCGATVLYPSTVEVYGNALGKDVFSENYTGKLNLATSRACYTESKRLSEALCQSYISEKGVKVKIGRLSRIFGPTILDSDSKASSQFIFKALKGEDIILKSEGKQYFSYTYVADAVSALLYILIHGENGQAYNISVDSCNVHLKDFASFCAKWARKEVVFQLPSDAERKGFSIATQAILDNSQLKAIGWNSNLLIEEAIDRTLEILHK